MTAINIILIISQFICTGVILSINLKMSRHLENWNLLLRLQETRQDLIINKVDSKEKNLRIKAIGKRIYEITKNPHGKHKELA